MCAAGSTQGAFALFKPADCAGKALGLKDDRDLPVFASMCRNDFNRLMESLTLLQALGLFQQQSYGLETTKLINEVNIILFKKQKGSRVDHICFGHALRHFRATAEGAADGVREEHPDVFAVMCKQAPVGHFDPDKLHKDSRLDCQAQSLVRLERDIDLVVEEMTGLDEDESSSSNEPVKWTDKPLDAPLKQRVLAVLMRSPPATVDLLLGRLPEDQQNDIREQLVERQAQLTAQRRAVRGAKRNWRRKENGKLISLDAVAALKALYDDPDLTKRDELALHLSDYAIEHECPGDAAMMLRAAVPAAIDRINVLELMLDDAVRDEIAASLTMTERTLLAARLRRRAFVVERLRCHAEYTDLLEALWKTSNGIPEAFEEALAEKSFTFLEEGPGRGAVSTITGDWTKALKKYLDERTKWAKQLREGKWGSLLSPHAARDLTHMCVETQKSFNQERTHAAASRNTTLVSMMRGALLRAKVKEPAEPIGAFVEFMSLEASRLEMDYPGLYPGVKQEFSMYCLAVLWSLPSWLDAGVGVLITEMREAVTSTTKRNRVRPGLLGAHEGHAQACACRNATSTAATEAPQEVYVRRWDYQVLVVPRCRE